MKYIRIIFFFFSGLLIAQEKSNKILDFQEYIGHVKQHHPILKQANLVITEGEAKLLASRGAFDPKLEVNHDKKLFKGSEYYSKLNGVFKIPTWYGVELKANYESNSGLFLNPESNIPSSGLYSVGVTLSLAQGMMIDERMATLKKAKLFTEQAKADQQILVNKVLFDAANAYFDWIRLYKEKELYDFFLTNASVRLKGITKSIKVGDRAAIDSVEARITETSRQLNLEKAKIKYLKASLQVANFLWLDQNTPLELKEGVMPEIITSENIEKRLENITKSFVGFDVQKHPKIISLDKKYESLELNRKLKANKLLPKINVSYNFLTQEPEQFNSLDINQYKAGFAISFPLFLRKERGNLNLAKQKLLDTQLEINTTKQLISNKIKALHKEIISLRMQTKLTQNMVKDYALLLKAEERKFDLGESSLFLINSRESKLISSKLKEIEVINSYQIANSKLINLLALEM